MKRIVIVIALFLFSNISAQQIEKELGQLYFQKNYVKLFTKTDSILQENPNYPSVNLIKGRALVDQGKLIEGKPFLEKAIKYDANNSWIKAWGLYYLGRIEFSNGNQEKARELLRNCLLMNATRNVNKSAKGVMLLLGIDNYYNDWQNVETEHFIFHFQQNTLVSNLKLFAKSREKAYLEINNFFNCNLPKKIDFFVWNGNEDANKKIGIKQLGFSKPKYCVIHSRANQTRGHEITHIITHYLSESPTITRFINEGTAVAFDLSNTNQLKKAIEYKNSEKTHLTISIVDVWNNFGNYPEWVYYPLAGEFVKRIIAEGGKARFIKLVVNQTYEEAIELYGSLLSQIIEKLEKEIN